MPKIGAVSVSLAVQLACLVLVPNRVGVFIVVTGMAIAKLIRNQAPEVVLFNSSLIGLDSGVFLFVLSGMGFDGTFYYPRTVLPVVVAGTTKLFVNVALISIVVALDNPSRAREAWQSSLRLAILPYFALMPLAVLGVLVYLTPAGISGILLLFVPLLLARLSLLAYMRLKESHLETIEALAAALEAKDSYSRGHSDRVGELARRTAQVMRFRASVVEEVENGGRLHDIGKIGVPDLVLKKPSPLTPEELETMRRHVEIGAEIVKPLSFLRSVTGMVRYHHEWFGGGGYPGEMEGTSIPLGARVLAVCDAWDAMTSNRIYRRAMEPLEAWRRLVAGAGTQFDPEVVSAFKKVIAADKLVPLDVLEAEEARIREERERESREEMMAMGQLDQGLVEAAAGQEERGEGV